MENLDKIYAIRRVVSDLLFREPPLGFLIQKVNFVYYDTPEDFQKYPELQHTYAGISFENFNFSIHINLNKMLKESRDFQIEVLKHEIGHISNGSFFRYKDLGINLSDPQQMQTWNIATDIPINENLTLLHEFGYHAKKLKLPINQTSEFYYNELIKNKNFQNQQNKDNHVDSHKIKEATPNQIKEIKHVTTKIIKESIKEAKAYDNSCAIPSNFQEIIDMINESTYNWIQEFRIFSGKYIGNSYRRTRSKINKRYQHFAGKTLKRSKDDIFIIIDTSASVSASMLQLFFNEIKKIFSLGHQIYIIECDADVQRSYRYFPSKQFSVQGRGGTLYQPAIDFATSKNPAFIVLFGDGGYFDKSLNEPENLIWVLPKGCNAETNNKKIFIGDN